MSVNKKKDKRLPLRFTSIVLLCVTIAVAVSLRSGGRKTYYTMPEALDKTVIVVDGTELTVQDVAFYIAYQEQQVEKEAYTYNPKDTREYWRSYTNGTYIRTEAKRAVVQMVVHDEIFYQFAKEEGLTLEEADETYLANAQYDFLSDLGEEGVAALGVSEDVLKKSMEKIALAEKGQQLYAKEHALEYDDYSVGSPAYTQLLEEHDYSVVDENWNRVHFGSITVNH